MTEDEAKILLKYHSFIADDLDHPKMANGFLGMLRPFKGELYEDNFHELMHILKVLSAEFSKEAVDRELISSFWSICYLAGGWSPDNLLTSEQREKLHSWLDCIYYAIMILLECDDVDEAFNLYYEYLRSHFPDREK